MTNPKPSLFPNTSYHRNALRIHHRVDPYYTLYRTIFCTIFRAFPLPLPPPPAETTTTTTTSLESRAQSPSACPQCAPNPCSARPPRSAAAAHSAPSRGLLVPPPPLRVVDAPRHLCLSTKTVSDSWTVQRPATSTPTKAMMARPPRPAEIGRPWSP